MQLIHFKNYSTDIKETCRLSLPIILGRLGAVLMGVIDSVMIGKVDYTSLAAAGITNAIFILVAIIPIGFLIVGSPMISSANSRGDKAEAVYLMKGCIQASIILSIFFDVILLIFAYNFQWFGQPSEVAALVPPFFYWIIASTLPLMIFIAVEQFTDGLEHTSISMFFNISGLFVNAGINWVLIYGHFRFPRLELMGAGIGTFLARVYMMIGIWLVVKYKKEFRSYDLRMNLLSVHRESFYRIFRNGIPSGLQFFFEVSAFSAAAVMVGWLGTVELAAHNVALSLASVSYMLSTGFATGGSIRVGWAYGMKDRQSVLRAGKSTLMLVVVLMSITAVAFVVFNHFWISLYATDGKVVQLATGLLLIAGLFQLADGIQVVSIRALLGIEDVNIPTILTLVAYWGVGLPVGALLAFYFQFGVHGMWIGLLLGLVVSAIVMTYRFLSKASKI